jgi:uncharacterized protein YceH (UPF0502 family)
MSPALTWQLDFVQARVLGVLIEKRHTVPDTYPMSLLALVGGCNQRTSRDPVMDLTEAQVQAAIDVMRPRSLVIESSGGRVMRYSENMARVLGVSREAVALLAVLILRGPQTAAELRLHSERLHRFADLSSVEGYLDELSQRSPQPLVVRLPVQPGSREARWAHALTVSAEQLLSAQAAVVTPPDSFSAASGDGAVLERLQALELRVQVLHDEVAALRQRLAPPSAS